MGGILHFISAFAVGSAAAWGAGVTLFGATAGAGIATQAAATFLGVTVGATLGVVAAPVIVATAIATVALVVGTVIGVVPGVISGTAKALQYHRHKDLVATAAAPPQDPSQAVIARVVGDFTSLPQDVQAALVEDLGHIVTGKISAQDKILQAAEKLSDTERVALIEKMRQDIAVAFSTVAERQIDKATVLGDNINVVRPIRLRNVNKTKASGGLAQAA